MFFYKVSNVLIKKGPHLKCGPDTLAHLHAQHLCNPHQKA